MKKIKVLLKRLIISYVIIFMTLSSMSSSFAGIYNAKSGETVSQYARDFIAQYCKDKKTEYSHVGFAKTDAPHWSGGAFGQGYFKGDCTNGVHYMYLKALGVDIAEYGYGSSSSAISNLKGKYSQYWQEITSSSEIQPGDVLLRDGH